LPAHARTVFADATPQVRRRQLELIEQRALPARVDRLPPKVREQIERGTTGHVAVEAEFAWQIADAAARFETVRVAVVTEDLRASGGWSHEVQEDANSRRLTGAVNAEEAEDLAGVDVERHVLERGDASVSFREMSQTDRRHVRLHCGRGTCVRVSAHVPARRRCGSRGRGEGRSR